MAIFSKLGKAAASLLAPTMAVGSGLGTFLTLMGILSFISISSSATVIGLPIGVLFAGVAIILGISVGIATLATSARPLWNKLSNLGQRLDNKIHYRKTNHKFYIDEVNDFLKETDHIINHATQRLNQMHHDISEIKPQFKKKIAADPDNKPYAGVVIFTELKHYKEQINCQIEVDALQATPSIMQQLNIANMLLDKASHQLRTNRTSDPLSREIDKQQVEKIRSMRAKIGALYHSVDILQHKIKAIKQTLISKYFSKRIEEPANPVLKAPPEQTAVISQLPIKAVAYSNTDYARMIFFQPSSTDKDEMGYRNCIGGNENLCSPLSASAPPNLMLKT